MLRKSNIDAPIMSSAVIRNERDKVREKERGRASHRPERGERMIAGGLKINSSMYLLRTQSIIDLGQHMNHFTDA